MPASEKAAPAPALRILAVGNMYPPHHAGGYELAWQRAMRHAESLGHSVRVLVSDYRQGGDLDEEQSDVHRTLRWYLDLDRYEFERLSLLELVQLERHNAAELRRQITEFRPDVVSWWSMGCMSLSMIEQVRRAEIPAIFVVHDDWLVYGVHHDQWIRTWTGRRRGRLAPVAERLCGVPARVELNAAGAFVFNSRYTLERARQTGLDTTAATVVHPGIDERFLEPAERQPWQWRLAYVGRIDRQKGIDTAVAALAQLPDSAILTIWGSGDQRYVAEMKALADRLGVSQRVRFEGFVSGDAVRSTYTGADAVIFPVRWNEPFGLVPLEAMGIGRVVVTTARGGTAEFVRDGENALVFTADDASDLAACLSRLGSDEALRARLRDGGLRTAAQFTAERFAERTVAEILRAATLPTAPRTSAAME